MTKVIDYL